MAKPPKEEIVIREVDPNTWMVTFSDLLTLLLTFFVLLLTMSSMDDQKFRESFGQLTPTPGVLTQWGATQLIHPNLIPLFQRQPPSWTRDI